MTNADRAALRASADSVLARPVGDTTGKAVRREEQWAFSILLARQAGWGARST
ncbi:hypothetical protein ACFV2V_20370 [Streptomyces sp. NPDC059698]|uniref:hypothetical protein n=1 Tax=unclassified Streptomyces TaxID=2593676 RepID=UPI0013015558|nr:hypothetical protein [Streptomyces sp. CB02366]WSS59579.1 hypothetical protein OG543_23620 [Streptomyces sp. NBC_01178]